MSGDGVTSAMTASYLEYIKIAGNTAIADSLWKLFNGVKGVKVKVNYLISFIG